MSDRLKGKNAVITGAGRGIGRAIALAMAEEGASVVVCDLGVNTDGSGVDKSPADKVVEECRNLGAGAVAHYGDVANFKDAEGMIKSCVDNFGRIDILCNIAGILQPQTIFDMTEEDWDRTIDIHLKGTFNLTRHAVLLMRQQRYGRIINCCSEAFLGRGRAVSYIAAKGGIASLTYGTAQEVGKYGITCNAFTSRARTRITANATTDGNVKKLLEDGLIKKEMLEQTYKKFSDPSYLASFIAYLASDAAAIINGVMFHVAGTSIGIWNKPVMVSEVTRDWEKEGPWRYEEIEKLVPEKLLVDYVNPAPPQRGKL